MKRSPLWGAALLSCALFTATAHAVEATEPLNILHDYESTHPAWTVWWAPTLNVGYTVIQNQITTGNNPATTGSHSYVIEAELTTSPYVYFHMQENHALFGDVNLTANIKVEVISGLASDARIDLGYGLYYPGAELNGMVINPFPIDPDTTDWQAIGGNVTADVTKHRADVAEARFALATGDDLLPYTYGPALYLFHDGHSQGRTLRVRITVDDVHMQGTVAPFGTYIQDARNVADAYVTRERPQFKALMDDAEAAYEAIDDLPLTATALHNALKAEALTTWQAQQGIGTAYANRTERLKVPTPAQYAQQQDNLRQLEGLLAFGQYALTVPAKTELHYAWQASGPARYNDQTLAVGPDVDQPLWTAMSLGEYEPLAFVLQNLDASAMEVRDVAVNLTNQFGQVFPAGRIDARVVKSWYTGSATSIRVPAMPIPRVRVAELLLRDDALVDTDDNAGKNYLRISSGGVMSYQDISSANVLMPNDAQTADSATLQPFTVEPFRSRQLWLTLNTLDEVRPGDYGGEIAVTYRRSGSGTDQVMNIPLTVNVLPRRLEDSPLLYSIYYRGRITPKHGLKSDDKTEQQYLAELVNMREHGITHPTQWLTEVGGTIAEFENYIGLRAQVGLPCDKYFVGNGIANFHDHTQVYGNAQQLLSALATLSPCASPQLYMYGADEPDTPKLNALRDLAWPPALNAGAKLFAAEYVGAYARMGDMVDTIILNGKPNAAEIASWRNAGKDIYAYNNPQVGVPDPFVYRRNFGLALWQHNYTGAMNYAYQDMFPTDNGAGRGDLSGGQCKNSTTHYCSAWNDFDSDLYFDHMFTYPTSDGVVDTVQWEGFREAIDDNRYLATLQAEKAALTNAPMAADVDTWIAYKKAQLDFDPQVTRGELLFLLNALLYENNQPPQISTTSHFTGGGSLIVIGDVSDPEGFLVDVSVKVGSGPWQAAYLEDGQWAAWFTGLSAGTHTVHYRAKDYYGVTTAGETDFTVAP